MKDKILADVFRMYFDDSQINTDNKGMLLFIEKMNELYDLAYETGKKLTKYDMSSRNSNVDRVIKSLPQRFVNTRLGIARTLESDLLLASMDTYDRAFREGQQDNPSYFTEQKINVPRHDCNIILVFPGGEEVLIECRPSNADADYNGSLDITLPEDQCVTNWSGDNMKAAKPVNSNRLERHILIAKQLVMELPGNYN